MVKYKSLGIVLFALLLLFLFIRFKGENNTSFPHRLKYWTADSTLTLDDFKKAAPIFNHDFAAEISYGIRYVHLDDGKYVAKACIDPYNSFFYEKAFSEQLLSHEKYHANIASVVAKEINDSIKNRRYSSYDRLRNYLDQWAVQKVDDYQNQYDKETNHGLNVPYQDYWEFKIDSLYTKDKELFIKDNYSGISCYFPWQPKLEIHVDSFMLRKVYILDKYNMRFRFITDYDFYADAESYKEYHASILSHNGFINQKITKGIFNGMSSLESSCSDTSGSRMFFDKVVFNSPYKYHLTVNYPLNTKNDTLYKRMKEHFFKSLSISNNNDHWINRFRDEKVKSMRRVDLAKNVEHDEYSVLVTKGESDYSILYHKPIPYNDSLLIPIQPVMHWYSEIESFVLFCDGSVFTQEVDSINGILAIKESELPINNSIQFGYTLKSDSIDNVYDLHGTIY